MRFVSAAAYLFVALFLPDLVAAAAPTQDEVDAATREKALAEARQAIASANKTTAEAEIAEARARLGTLDLGKLTPPTAEATSLKVETSLMAYVAADAATRQVADAVLREVPNKEAPILIFTEKEMRSLMQVRIFSSNLGVLLKDMKALKVPRLDADNPQCTAPVSETGGGSGIGPLGALDIAAQVLNLFKTNRKLEGSDVTLEFFGVAASAIDKLKVAGYKKVIFPPMFLAGGTAGTGLSPVARDVDGIGSATRHVDDVVGDVAKKRQELQEKFAKGKGSSKACKEALTRAESTFADIEGKAKTLKARAESYVAAAMTPDEKSGETLLQSLVAAEALESAAKGGYVLQLKPLTAGGATQTKTNFFRSSIRVGGGAAVSYMLVKSAGGDVVASGLAADYGGFVAPEDLSARLQNRRPASTETRPSVDNR